MVADGSVIKSQPRPEVYVVQNGQRHWIPDPSTLQAKWSWSQVQTLDKSVVDAIPLGDPVPSALSGQKWPDGALLMAPPASEVYIINSGQRHWIPDPATFQAGNYSWDAVESVPADILNAIPLGAQIPVTSQLMVDTGDVNLGGSNWTMNTHASLTRSGQLLAVTHTSCGFPLGFHGGVCIIAADNNDLPLAQTAIQRYGVDPIFGPSSRTDPWSAQVDPTKAQTAMTLRVIQAWDPDNFQTILNQWTAASKTISALASAIGSVAKIF